MDINFQLQSLDGKTYQLTLREIAQPPAQAPSQQAEALRAVSHPTPSRFVTVELASAITGLSKAAIRTKISRGIWVDGRQYVKREGRVFIDLKGYERWVESGK